jgi:hypothetical protein
LDNRHQAFVFGLVDNQTKKIAESGKPWEIIQSIHNVHVEASKMNISETARTDYVRVKLETLHNQHCPTDCSSNTFGTYRVMGGHKGKIWEGIYTLFKDTPEAPSGGAPPKKKKSAAAAAIKPPKLSHFIGMANIPDRHLEEWISFILSGVESTREFQERCVQWKKVARVEQQVIQFANEWSNKNYISVHDAKKEIPALKDEKWWELVVGCCGPKTSDLLPASCKELIRNAIAVAQKLKEKQPSASNSSQSLQVQIYVCMCCICTYVMYNNSMEACKSFEKDFTN